MRGPRSVFRGLSLWSLICAYLCVICCVTAEDTEARYILVEQFLSRDDAENFCRSEYGTSLASIHSSEENEEAFELCDEGKTFDFWDADGFNGCWIGYYKDNGEYVWTDSSANVYQNWRIGAPSDGAECTFIRVNYKPEKWEDSPDCPNSKGNRYALCNAPGPTPSPTPNPTHNPTPAPTTSTTTSTPAPGPTSSPIPNPTPAPTPSPTPNPTPAPSSTTSTTSTTTTTSMTTAESTSMLSAMSARNNEELQSPSHDTIEVGEEAAATKWYLVAALVTALALIGAVAIALRMCYVSSKNKAEQAKVEEDMIVGENVPVTDCSVEMTTEAPTHI